MRDSHVYPDEALSIHLDVRAKHSLGVHRGAFPLTDEPLDQPPHDLADAQHTRGVAEEVFFPLPVGGTRFLPTH
jgi:N-acyl-phosphatidylethanolamine-hydrolysing phospholipase D